MCELKPCPFCGNNESKEFAIKKVFLGFIEAGLKNTSVQVICYKCASRGSLARNQKTVIEAWNKREGKKYE